MPLTDVEYTLTLMQSDGVTPDLVVTSHGTNPYLSEPPEGDGFGIDIVNGTVEYGSYTVTIADVETSPGIRIVTAKLGDIAGAYDKLTRRVVVEKSVNGGALERHVDGFLTNISFPDELTAQLEFGDGNRAASTRELFVEATGAFDKGTAIIGGPIRGGFAGRPDNGPWRMKVTAAASGVVTLRFVRGPVPVFDDGGLVPTGEITQAVGNVAANVANYINLNALHYTDSTESGWYAPGLVMRIEPAGGGAVTYETPLVSSPSLFGGVSSFAPKLVDASTIRTQWSGALPAVNAEFDIYVQPLAVSEENPIHLTGHPIDIQTAIWDELGEAWDAAAAATVKAAVGPNRSVFLSIDKPWKQDAFETMLRKAFLFSYDEGPDGEKVLKSWRRSSTLPSVTITETEQLGDEEGNIPDPIFELDESTIVNKVTVVQTIFRPVTASFLFARMDFVVRRTQTDSITLDGSAGDHEITIEIPGMVVDTFAGGFSYGQFAEHIAPEYLTRFGKGCPSVPLIVDHTVTARVGDSVILDVDHQINGTVRGGSRIIQVIHRTEMEDGVALDCLDGGLTSQAATTPTFSLAASGIDPKRFFSATITNAAVLAAAGYWVRAEWGIGGSAPATGSGLALVDPALTTVIASPQVDAGSHIWVRMRSEHMDQRPTAFSAWQGLNLTDLVAPSGLSRTGNVLTWTNGESTAPVEVLWRPTAESVNTRAALLPAGSTRFDYGGYVPASTNVTLSVRHVDTPPYGGVSSFATDAYVTAAGAALTAPLGQAAWVGSGGKGAAPDGYYGIDVSGTVFPSHTVVEIAVETGVGTNVYGAFLDAGGVPTVQFGRTRFGDFVGNDRLRRKLRARHRVGDVFSSYTPEVGPVDPWGTAVGPSYLRVDTPFVNTTGTQEGYPTIGNAAGELTGHLRGDQELRAGSLYVEATEDIAAGTVAVPDTMDVDIHFPPASFQPGNESTEYNLSDNQIKMGVATPIATTINLYAPLVIAKGAVITGIDLRGRRDGAADTCELELRRIHQSGGLSTILATATLTLTGYSTKTAALSETVGASDAYAIRVTMINTSAAGDAVGLVYAKVYYQKALPLRQSV